MERSLSAGEQIALIEDRTHSQFLPSLRFFELTLEQLNSLPISERIAFVYTLRSRALSQGCHAFDIPDYSPGSYPNIDDYMSLYCTEIIENTTTHQILEITKKFVVVDVALTATEPSAGIIGYICATYIPDKGSIFRYNTNNDVNIYAAIAYISWTCSFTNDESIKSILSAKLAAYPGKKLSVGTYLLVNLLQDFTTYISTIKPAELHISIYILWSLVLHTARRAHRKVGKRSACKFLTQWRSIIDSTVGVKDVFNTPYSKNNMIYTYPPLLPGMDLYNTLVGTYGANINTKINAPMSLSNLNNASYVCPLGGPIMGINNNDNYNNNNAMKAGGTRRKKHIKHLTKSRRRRRTHIQATQ